LVVVERPLLRLKFAKVSKPYVLLWRGELVAIYPLSERENRWRILQWLVALRDLLWSQDPTKN
jgi:hypothetical protein